MELNVIGDKLKTPSNQSSPEKLPRNHAEIRKALAQQLKSISKEEYNELKKIAREKAAQRKAEP